MSKFITDLEVELKKGNDKIWVLKSPLIYESDSIGLIKVPTGFETDFASVPRVPIAFWFYGDTAHRESVIHDYLYKIDTKPKYARKIIDSVFLEAMECRMKPWYVKYPMYWGVRLGGWVVYNKYKV